MERDAASKACGVGVRSMMSSPDAAPALANRPDDLASISKHGAREDGFIASHQRVLNYAYCPVTELTPVLSLVPKIEPFKMSRQGSPAKRTPRPTAVGETWQPRSLEPTETATDVEFTLVTRLVQGLEGCDWDQLQERYTDAMDEHSRVEEDLRAETAKVLEIFTAWSQTTVLQDETRALKRFKTQMQHVQNSEASVESKRKHYMDVVKAFQSALALLNEQMKV
ncbi:uncharacterized protein N7482_005311 [Penicillium canariense]|uniref:Uncharacterized protein n=1 Tax=Penicillium canariense TaxID=189055 RepID=A0A9W9I259_9EURO|nr:uncharacterized protein N7482_005311 [Penicillium canariense]KAJ5166530.1 hypothetical protein N7482_005311 [Penicillium canariense]